MSQEALHDTTAGDTTTEAPRAAARPGLWVVFSPSPGIEGQTLRLGPAGAALNRWTELDDGALLASPRISKRHAAISSAGDGWQIRDLGSKNGTRVDGVAITESAPLRPGAVVDLGGTFLQLLEDVRAVRAPEPADDVAEELIGPSPAMREARSKVRDLARATQGVLLLGPPGVGKERAASALHRASGRAGKLICVNAATLTPELAASTLFGHDKGAFTGADQARPGAFRAADGGTLFLDEIGELPLNLQSTLLRVLETRSFAPVGSDREVSVDVRVIAATNRDLPAMVARGSFRGDLFSRIASAVVTLPALRARPADVIALAHHFLAGPRLHHEAAQVLLGHPWPHNVRDLRAVVSLLDVDADGVARVSPAAEDKLRLDARLALPAEDEPAPGLDAHLAWPDSDEAQAALLERLLEEYEGNLTQIGKALGKAPRSLRRWLAKYQLDAASYRPD